MATKLCPICGLIVDERHKICAECGDDWADPSPFPYRRCEERKKQFWRSDLAIAV